MNVEQIDIEKLIPYANNSRTHNEYQVGQIASSIRQFGFNNPVLVDEETTIIAGHGRVLAAMKLGLKVVPCIRLSHLSESQKRAYIIADNKIALNSDWDNELLALELTDLKDAGYDMEVLGFTIEEFKTITGMVEEVGLPELPDGDKEPYQQITFTLHDEQKSIVDNAIALARTNPLADTGLNENTNGNALALICEEWLKSNNG
jgi:ParB-like chromosome segregation protein Spo0J